MNNTVANMLNSSGRILQPGTIIKTDGSYAFITAKNYNLLSSDLRNLSVNNGNDDSREPSLLFLTNDKIISPLPSSLM